MFRSTVVQSKLAYVESVEDMLEPGITAVALLVEQIRSEIEMIPLQVRRLHLFDNQVCGIVELPSHIKQLHFNDLENDALIDSIRFEHDVNIYLRGRLGNSLLNRLSANNPGSMITIMEERPQKKGEEYKSVKFDRYHIDDLINEMDAMVIDQAIVDTAPQLATPSPAVTKKRHYKAMVNPSSQGVFKKPRLLLAGKMDVNERENAEKTPQLAKLLTNKSTSC